MKQKSKLKDLIEDIVDSDLLALDESEYQSHEESRDEDEDDEDEVEESADEESEEMDEMKLIKSAELVKANLNNKFKAGQKIEITTSHHDGRGGNDQNVKTYTIDKVNRETLDITDEKGNTYRFNPSKTRVDSIEIIKEADEDEVEESADSDEDDMEEAIKSDQEDDMEEAAESEEDEVEESADSDEDDMEEAAESEEDEDEEEEQHENFKVDLTNVSNLIESEEGLTEEFKSKAALIFEAEVKSQLRTIREGLKKTYARRLEEAVATVEESLTEQIDGYLTYAVQQWMKENQVAVESSIRTEIAENFMSSLKTLFTESYVEVPASKLDLFAKLEEEKQEVESKLNRSLGLLSGLVEKVEDMSRTQAIEEACEDLTQTEALRLKKLAESVEFTSENSFADKVKTLKEFYFTNKSVSKNKTKTLTEETLYEDSEVETFVEGEIVEQTKIDPEMSQYLKALNAMNKSVTY
jgi:hypothetical protein